MSMLYHTRNIFKFHHYINRISKFFVLYYFVNDFCFILFCRTTYDPFCSVEINTATFHRLGFTFLRRCTVVKKHVCERKTFRTT